MYRLYIAWLDLHKRLAMAQAAVVVPYGEPARELALVPVHVRAGGWGW